MARSYYGKLDDACWDDCPMCHNLLRPNVVFFGEQAPKYEDMFLEMDTAAKIHKLSQRNPTVMSAWEVLKMATIDGARALGLSDVGTLSPGKKADLIVVDLNQPHLMPLYDVVSHLVYVASGKDVITTIVDGKILMENRKLLTLDIEEIYSQVNCLRLKA